jgi:hypothetical protein
MEPADVTRCFTRSDGSFAFARWGRPIAPIVFGVQDETLGVLKGALEAMVDLAGHSMAETDPELGANLMFFFFRDWEELLAVPDLGRMVEGLEPLVARLSAQGANQYRLFRFDAQGAIRSALVFLRVDAALGAQPVEELALAQAAQVMLLWSDTAFAHRSPLAIAPGGAVILRPDVAGIIRAGYDPVMPVSASDPAHALRLAARLPRA